MKIRKLLLVALIIPFFASCEKDEYNELSKIEVQSYERNLKPENDLSLCPSRKTDLDHVGSYNFKVKINGVTHAYSK